MYKWFFWSEKKKMYFPLPGLRFYPRSSFPNVDFFGHPVTSSFSIPMFNVHNVVK